MSLNYWRQLDLVSPEKLNSLSITLIGAGGIGSPTALILAKMGITHLTVYDHDKVDDHNLPNQIYRLDDLGKPKVQALAEILASHTGITITAKEEQYHNQHLSGIVISAVDSMNTRQIIWNRIKFNPRISYYIEGRMGAEIGRINTVIPTDPDDVNWYQDETNLYSDQVAIPLPCTAQAIIYNTFMAGSLIAGQVKKIATGEVSRPKREITFDSKNYLLM